MGKYTLVLTGIALTVGLNSCYFNSAGKIVDKASYKALSTTSDIAQNQLIYCKDGQYYIELPRYRNEKPVKLHYSITDEESTGYFGTRTVNEETRRDDSNIYYETKTYRQPCYRCGGSGRKSDEDRTINNAKGSLLDMMIFGETSKNGSFMGNFL